MQTQINHDPSRESRKNERLQITVDGNEACALVAYKCNELIAIYPITPSSPMAELSDSWASAGKRNIFGTIPFVQEMQSEGGAAGAAHGALMSGALTTSFTASQGLLLMIPNMFKLAGELTSTVFHVTARAVATHGLSIFCDHSDVMATRSTGWALLFGSSVQEAHDLALVAQAATLKTRIPFLHIFDGFRTSHEVAKITSLSDDDISFLIDRELVKEHRKRGLNPSSPSIKGTAQNPDVFFQSREGSNRHYDEAADLVQNCMDELGAKCGRYYRIFDYHGAPDAERLVVVMGSAACTLNETADYLNSHGEKVGVINVHLYRPFSKKHFLQALPESTRVIAVLDRTKEPGSAGEPLLQDVLSTLFEERRNYTVIGGRYGLGSKEFTPAMAKAVFDECRKPDPKKRFTIGIFDDITQLSLDYDENFNLDTEGTVQAIFWGLGSDGTVGANKNTIKIIGEESDYFAQGYFVYDSKKSGSLTVSHLRFGPREIKSPYLIQRADFVGIHQFGFLGRYPVLDGAVDKAVVLINSPFPADKCWSQLPKQIQTQIRSRSLKVYLLDAYKIAKELGLGNRINTIMQTGFFALSGVLPRDTAIAEIKKAIKKTYGKFGEPIIKQNYAAVDAAVQNLQELIYEDSSQAHLNESSSSSAATDPSCPLAWTDACSEECMDFCPHCASANCAADCLQATNGCSSRISTNTMIELIAGRGDKLPVSALPLDGTYPTGTACIEKRNIATEIPVWDPAVCIQCGKCVMVCPHAVIRSKLVPASTLESCPATFQSQQSSWKELKDHKFTLQISAEDCTGCAICVEICPAKNKSQSGKKAINMIDKSELVLQDEQKNWEYFLSLPEFQGNDDLHLNSVKNMQLRQPLFEFSGACAGCGETPYLKLLSQLFGDRAVIANATGCSSIYGGNLPTTPWTKNRDGRGPAWANSLFEDNAEFGLGIRLAINVQLEHARQLLAELSRQLTSISPKGEELCRAILEAEQNNDAEIQAQRNRVNELQALLPKLDDPNAPDLFELSEIFVKRSVWLVGGDGWAYDIGYGGLDHVLASGQNVNILVLDTEVYSNTGGQMSKSTARGAVAKFAASGKESAKKDLARLAISYGNVYVAHVAMGANDTQTINAFIEAESYDGPSLIIAYSHCIAHGIDMRKGMNQQKLAVNSGHWPLFRYDPRLQAKGQAAFHLDSQEAQIPLEEYYYSETRYRMLKQKDPPAAARLLKAAKLDLQANWRAYKALAEGSQSIKTPIESLKPAKED